MSKNLIVVIFVAINFFFKVCYATCIESTALKKFIPNDALSSLLHDDCAHDVMALRKIIANKGMHIVTTLVANEGYHNQRRGSFSFFEIVSGKLITSQASYQLNQRDFFFGHFTAIDAENRLILSQTPDKNALLIEAMVWDTQQGGYNFYELRGEGYQSQWYYRGNSYDILADNIHLHRQFDPNAPRFGTRLRCAACHSLGGPIMKELSNPHNDWWQPERPFDFGGRKLDSNVQAVLTTLVPASQLAASVKAGVEMLYQDPAFRKHLQSLTLQEQLRPLFCPVELNLASDQAPLSQTQIIKLPIEFFIDTRLLNGEPPTLTIDASRYQNILSNSDSHFPNSQQRDADHAWLTPVKAYADKVAIETVIKLGVIDRDFMIKVLSVDMTNPVFSKTRCDLLRYIPLAANRGWQQQFLVKLNKTPTSQPDAALNYLHACQQKLTSPDFGTSLYMLLAQRRLEIWTNEISKNPLGKILEPDFRLIFPVNNIQHTKHRLDLLCNVLIEGPHAK